MNDTISSGRQRVPIHHGHHAGSDALTQPVADERRRRELALRLLREAYVRDAVGTARACP